MQSSAGSEQEALLLMTPTPEHGMKPAMTQQYDYEKACRLKQRGPNFKRMIMKPNLKCRGF